MQSATVIDIKTGQAQHEEGTFTRRIGFTTYRVGIHFSRTSRETANDKIVRLVRNEAAAGTTEKL